MTKLNDYHPNIVFQVDNNTDHFLDTTIKRTDNNISTSVFTKPNKFPVFLTSRIPNSYKRNSVRADVYRAFKIASNFNEELNRIRKKYFDAGYPLNFINSVILKIFSSHPNPALNPICELFSMKLPFSFNSSLSLLLRIVSSSLYIGDVLVIGLAL